MEKEIVKRVTEYRDYCLRMYHDYSEDDPFKTKWLNAVETSNNILYIIEVVVKDLPTRSSLPEGEDIK